MKRNNVIISRKKFFREFIEYLVDSYYINPNKELNVEEIRKKLKINEINILENFVSSLKKKKYIKFKKRLFVDIRKDNFIITNDGFFYLEALQNKDKEYQNSIMSIIVAIVTLNTTAICELYDNIVIKSIGFIVLIIILWISTNKIFNKKYY